MFFKIGALRNFATLTKKRLCWSLFFVKKWFQHRYFPVNIARFLRTAFFIGHLRQMFPNSNLILATQILTKVRRSYFYILIIAMQNIQILLKIYDLFIHCYMNVTFIHKWKSKENSWEETYNRARYLNQTQAIM